MRKKIEKREKKTEGGLSTGQKLCLKIPLDKYRDIWFFLHILLIAKNAFKVRKKRNFCYFSDYGDFSKTELESESDTLA